MWWVRLKDGPFATPGRARGWSVGTEWASQWGLLLTCCLTLAVFCWAVAALPVARSLTTDRLSGLAVRTNPKPQIVLANPASTPGLSSSPSSPPAPPLTIPASAPAVPNATPAPASRFDSTYTVRPGDTLFSVARRYNVSPQSLAAANGIADSGLIRVGQKLIVP